ncbi:MAG: PEP-CTERM sorting domain-containing protein [Planctomycetaceae bacterium]|nr:PEP-CTERM sorting domain-containing protein [Planctomycetaceae bacterium]
MRLVACILAVAVSSVSAFGATQVIYSSFGPGDSFSNDGAAGIGGTASFRGFQSVANAFTVSGGDFQLGKIEVATVWDSGTNSLVVSVAADNAGIPGTTIESFSLSGLMTGEPGSIVSMTSTLHPLLSNGSSYWVVLEAGAEDASAAWCDSLLSVEGTHAWDEGNGWQSVTSKPQAFRVTAVPEPATMSLLALGGLAALIRRRKA